MRPPEAIEETPYVFTYGTLMRGLYNHHYAEQSEFIDEGKTVDKFKMYSGGFPFLTRKDEESVAIGEIYRVSVEQLAAMDRLEGHPRFYERQIIPVVDSQGKKYRAWVYLADMETVERYLIKPSDWEVKDGDFRAWHKKRMEERWNG